MVVGGIESDGRSHGASDQVLADLFQVEIMLH